MYIFDVDVSQNYVYITYDVDMDYYYHNSLLVSKFDRRSELSIQKKDFFYILIYKKKNVVCEKFCPPLLDSILQCNIIERGPVSKNIYYTTSISSLHSLLDNAPNYLVGSGYIIQKRIIQTSRSSSANAMPRFGMALRIATKD